MPVYSNLLILGATGRVGAHLLTLGLERGYNITALVRTPEKLGAFAGKVRVVQGDVLDPGALAVAVNGQDAVLYAIGSGGPGRTTLFSESTRLLAPAMALAGANRLVAITGVGAGETKGHGGLLYDRIFFPLFTKFIYRDKEKQEEIIRNTRLDWTIVRPAAFREGQAHEPFQAVTDVADTVLRRVSRAEVARFVLDELEAKTFLHQTPFIGHRR